MLSNELALTVGCPGDRPVPGCRPALSGQQKSPHIWEAGEGGHHRTLRPPLLLNALLHPTRTSPYRQLNRRIRRTMTSHQLVFKDRKIGPWTVPTIELEGAALSLQQHVSGTIINSITDGQQGRERQQDWKVSVASGVKGCGGPRRGIHPAISPSASASASTSPATAIRKTWMWRTSSSRLLMRWLPAFSATPIRTRRRLPNGNMMIPTSGPC